MKRNAQTGKKSSIDDSRFTLIELLMVIAIIGILAAMLLPATSRAKDIADRTVCAGNERQISLMVFGYADAYNEFVPPHSGSGMTIATVIGDTWSWVYRLSQSGFCPKGKRYDSTFNSAEILWCKQAMKEERWSGYPRSNYISYGMNLVLACGYFTRPVRLTEVKKRPSKIVMLVESDASLTNSNYGTCGAVAGNVSARHHFQNPWIMVDGSAKMVKTMLVRERQSYYDYRYYGPFRLNPAEGAYHEVPE